MKKYGGALFFLIFLVGQFTSCSKQDVRFVYNQDKEYVAIKQLKLKAEDLYQHPFQITPEQLTNILDNIYYKHMMLIRYVWSKPKLTFSKRQQAFLAAHLSQALAQAGADEQVEFSIIDPEHERKRTNGKVFIDDQGLNLFLNSLHEPEYTTAVDRYELDEARWKFWPLAPNQGYKCLQNNQKKCQKNWLVIKLPNGGASENSNKNLADQLDAAYTSDQPGQD
ncbi:MAG: hypothetical protein ABH859_04260 [Pseudomonadota bacterium]